jgi:hypothetical protein
MLQSWKKNEPEPEGNMWAVSRKEKEEVKRGLGIFSEFQFQYVFLEHAMLILQNSGEPEVTFFARKIIFKETKNRYN